MTRAFDVVPLIEAKRDGAELPAEAIRWLVYAYMRGDVAPEQMSAFAMAVYFRGMTRTEVFALTSAMTDSGQRLDLGGLRRDGAPVPSVDKHSTGGVGDSLTLVVAPLLATYPVAVPKLSGRGLGHTGGTLDKLESIPGWRGDLGTAELRSVLERTGAVVCAAGVDLAPADKAVYALRDVTGTVPSIPLIASSIMSKKLAGGADALVLDVKCGSGAFMRDRAGAEELARMMVDIATDADLRCSAMVTDMHAPLGRFVGNALEVAECRDVLAGGGPEDMRTLAVELVREALALVGIDDDPAARLDDGSAMDAWRFMISAQGGDPDASLPVAAYSEEVRARGDGAIDWDALRVGRASWRAGAGRDAPGQAIDPTAGVKLVAVQGQMVRRGDVVARVHASAEAKIAGAVIELADAYRLRPGRDARPGHDAGAAVIPLPGTVLERIRA